MTILRRRVHADERGAALILAIAFLLVVGAIGAAVASSVSSGLNDRQTLDQVRARQYAADGAVEWAIARVRRDGPPEPPVTTTCGPFTKSDGVPTLNGVDIRVDCASAATETLTGFRQLNVIFSACVDTGSACTDATTVVRAQVNFQAVGTGASLTVQKTWVQSWSVNR